MLSMIVITLIISVFILLTLSYIQMLYNYQRKVKLTQLNSTVTQTVKEYPQAPGPRPWPIIGNLAIMGRYDVPFQAFTELAKEYGDAYSLTLGSVRCLVVNNLELIREVLNQNGKFFGGRPDFIRYIKLFGGDRNNSLALCDWSHLQQKRRNLARRHCSPRDSSSYFTKMSNVGCFEATEFLDRLKEKLTPGQAFEVKPLIQQTCANMFSKYMCSMRFDYEDLEFQKIVEYFDNIFWEINQGYSVDFLPWLTPFYRKHFDKITHWSSVIRKFILDRVIVDRENCIDLDEPENDFTDALLKSLAEDNNVSRDTILFMLEDFIGGHSAVGNLVMLALAYIAKNPIVGTKIQEEVDRLSNGGQRKINFYDMNNMPYTLATIYEVLRYSSSPIVPHVATEDVVISGYGVTAGTIVFINNYKLNTTEEYWNDPKAFDPERFLEKVPITSKSGSHTGINNLKRRNSEESDSGIEFEKDILTHAHGHGNTPLPEGTVISSNNMDNNNKCDDNDKKQFKLQVKKNIPHFLPFSIGKRTCIGQNLVRGFGFILLANILQNYSISTNEPDSIITYPACVALPAKTFPLIFTERCN